jgi:hypothetical protein
MSTSSRGLSRRQLLKLGGIGMASLAVPGIVMARAGKSKGAAEKS